MPLLSVEDLTVVYRPDDGPPVVAVDRVSLTVERGEVVAVVGESGCGKSTLALAITRLVPPPGEIQRGRIVFDGQDVRTFSTAQLCALRGRRIGYVFQDPATSLNPVLTIGRQVKEALPQPVSSRRALDAQAVALLSQVGIPSAAERLSSYPHELSGGMQQRVMIAMAIASNPALLIADEPTTALDVTIQVQILQLLKKLQAQLGLSILLISHDLLVVERLCHRVAVMSKGALVEVGSVADVLAHPTHSVTQQLLAARSI